ncbi:MAG: metal-dependent transcriptional regulator [Deltaproteobacteria bacterium]|nr:metal-dependent transcriptional regulator [Deltaproteobacteria bacterium]
MKEKYEEILEAIWKSAENGAFSLEEIKKRCDVPVSEDDFSELENQKLIDNQRGKITFSSEGRRTAEKIIRRNRLAAVLLNSILKLRNSKMEELACKIEHTLLPEVEEAICTLLGHPQVSPNGKPIPRGKCCEKGAMTVNNVVINLTDLKPGERGKVSYIKPSNHSQLHQLLSFGVNPGVELTVHRTVPTLCIKFENTELALDEEIAKNIFVVRTSARTGTRL